MRSQFAFLALLTGSWLGCITSPAPETNSTEEAVDSTVTTRDHSDVLQLLLPARYKKDWFIPSPDRWADYWRQQYADSLGDLHMRSADFDGDDRVDHALFLCRTDTSRRDSAYALVVSFGNGRDTLLASYPWAEAQGGIGMGLTVQWPGPMGHLGGEEGVDGILASPVLLKNYAVTMVFFEKAAITWFWEKGAFHQVWTGD